ncbi:hypothetical protein GCM10009613_55470 [Pseudonocardia kongjuensis]|uniref:Uncharacterized protein n=1 Tax=Pseudonocardia kongjuensis TaxID=102227 RepID=A0ABN1Y8V9_9PSEU
MTIDSADEGRSVPRPRPHVTIEELARRKGVHPVGSLDDMARDVFASDDDLDEFLAFVHTDRQAGSRNRCDPSSWIPTPPPEPSRTGSPDR